MTAPTPADTDVRPADEAVAASLPRRRRPPAPPAHPFFRFVFPLLVALAGVVTLAGPWLAGQPAIHSVLEALGCRSI